MTSVYFEDSTIFEETIVLKNGKKVIKYIDDEGISTSKPYAEFMEVYIYNNKNELIKKETLSNPRYAEVNKFLDEVIEDNLSSDDS